MSQTLYKQDSKDISMQKIQNVVDQIHPINKREWKEI